MKPYLTNWQFHVSEDPFRKHAIKVECLYKLSDDSCHYFWTLINQVLVKDGPAVTHFAKQFLAQIKRYISTL